MSYGYCEHCGSGPTCSVCGRDDRERTPVPTRAVYRELDDANAAGQSVSFQTWLSIVSDAFCGEYGLSVHDVEDQPFREWYDDGYTPGEAVNEMAEELGVDF